MTEKEDRKEFVEPELSKFEEPLDEVTLQPTCVYVTGCPGDG